MALWNESHDYQIVDYLPPDLGDTVSLDIEDVVTVKNMKDHHRFHALPYCFSFTDKPGRAFITTRGSENVIQELIDSGRRILFWNFKSDYHVMKNAGLSLPKGFIPDDGMLYRFLQDTNATSVKKLKATAMDLFQIEHPEWNNDIYVSKSSLQLYAGGDAELHWMCFEELEKRLSTHLRQYDIERRILLPLWHMEREGLRIDQNRLMKLQKLSEYVVNKTKAKIIELAGVHFEIDSPAQVSTILYERLRLPHPEKRLKNGYFSTDKLTLNSIKKAHPIVSRIMLYKRLVKRKGTYIDALWKYISPDGKVHTDFLQFVTPTKRLASTAPNMLNQPKRHQSVLEEKMDVRSVFIPEPGHYFLKADFSQIEFRLMIYSSGNTNLIRRMEEGEDFHVTTAGIIRRTRGEGKTFNYALCYGADEHSVQFRLGCTSNESRRIMREFDEQYAGLRPWMEAEKAWALKHGWSRTFLGSLRPLPELKNADRKIRAKALRNVVNDQIQGGAAEIFKLAIIRVYNRMTATWPKLNLPIHDEILMQIPNEVSPSEASDFAINAMQINVGRMGKYPVDVSMGPLWSETYKLEEWIPIFDNAMSRAQLV